MSDRIDELVRKIDLFGCDYNDYGNQTRELALAELAELATVTKSALEAQRIAESERDSEIHAFALAVVNVLLKWDETSALYDIKCCCCPEHVEYQRALTVLGLDHQTLVSEAFAAHKAIEEAPK